MAEAEVLDGAGRGAGLTRVVMFAVLAVLAGGMGGVVCGVVTDSEPEAAADTGGGAVPL